MLSAVNSEKGYMLIEIFFDVYYFSYGKLDGNHIPISIMWYRKSCQGLCIFEVFMVIFMGRINGNMTKNTCTTYLTINAILSSVIRIHKSIKFC